MKMTTELQAEFERILTARANRMTYLEDRMDKLEAAGEDAKLAFAEKSLAKTIARKRGHDRRSAYPWIRSRVPL